MQGELCKVHFNLNKKFKISQNKNQSKTNQNKPKQNIQDFTTVTAKREAPRFGSGNHEEAQTRNPEGPLLFTGCASSRLGRSER